jgi:excisionase family DNA binding protein
MARQKDRISDQREPLAYDIRQAEVVSSLSSRKLSDAIRRGELRSFKKGRRRIIMRADLEDYLRK